MRSRGEGAFRPARLGVFIALAGALQALESLVPSPAPWFRLGLGNAPILAALQLWGPTGAFWVAFGKVVAGGLLSGRLFAPGALLALGGTLAATAVMAVAARARPLGFVGLSALGAQTHALIQLALASYWLLDAPALWNLAPILGTLSLASGTITGLLAHALARAAHRA